MANSLKKRGQKNFNKFSRASYKASEEGKEHIKEHLNLQLDFKSIVNDTWSKVFDFAKNNKTPTTRNYRIFEVAKELLIHNGTLFDVDELVNKATELVDKVGIETN